MRTRLIVFLFIICVKPVLAQCFYDWGTADVLNKVTRAITKDHSSNIISVAAAGGYDYVVKRNSAGAVLFSKTFYADDFQVTTDVYVDVNNNIYLTGFHKGNIHFGTTTLTVPGIVCTQIFVIKLSPTGNLLWMKQSTGNTTGSSGDGDDLGYAVSADANGDCYVSGFYDAKFIFGAFSLTGTASNAFIAKLDGVTGAVLWLRVNNPNDNSIDNKYMESCRNGDFYQALNFIDDIYVDSLTLVPADRMFEQNICVAMYNKNGYLKWFVPSVGMGLIYTATMDKHQNMLITGQMTDSLGFGPYKIYSMFEKSIFLLKIDTLGTVLTLERLIVSPNVSDNLKVSEYGLDTDSLDNVYLSGTMENELNFNGLTTTDVITSGNTSYAVKYDNALTPVWYNIFATSTSTFGGNTGIVKLDNKNAYTTGTFYNDIVIDSTAFFVGDSNFHQYFAELCDLNGAFIDPALSEINEFSSAKIAVFPVPASDHLNIVLPAGEEITELEIFNSSGMLMYRAVSFTGRIELGNQQYQNGLYIIRVQLSGERTGIIKFSINN